MLAIFTARKRSLRRSCFYRCVCLSTGGGGRAWHVAWGCAWQGGIHDRGHAWGGCVHGGGGGACVPQQILRDTVNERAVRILLECILVSLMLFAFAPIVNRP